MMDEKTKRGAAAGTREDAARTVSDDDRRAFFRAENEDDDGYDPYSDRIVREPLFERDPWD